jgi:hypothetical protein
VWVELLALLGGLLLGVVEPGESPALAAPDPLQVDEDAGGDQGTGQ